MALDKKVNRLYNSDLALPPSHSHVPLSAISLSQCLLLITVGYLLAYTLPQSSLVIVTLYLLSCYTSSLIAPAFTFPVVAFASRWDETHCYGLAANSGGRTAGYQGLMKKRIANSKRGTSLVTDMKRASRRQWINGSCGCSAPKTGLLKDFSSLSSENADQIHTASCRQKEFLPQSACGRTARLLVMYRDVLGDTVRRLIGVIHNLLESRVTACHSRMYGQLQ